VRTTEWNRLWVEYLGHYLRPGTAPAAKCCGLDLNLRRLDCLPFRKLARTHVAAATNVAAQALPFLK